MHSGIPFGGQRSGFNGPSRCNSTVNSLNLPAILETAKKLATFTVSSCTSIATIAVVAFPVAKIYLTVERTNNNIKTLGEQMKRTNNNIKTLGEQMKRTDKDIKTLGEQMKRTDNDIETLGEQMKRRKKLLEQQGKLLEKIANKLRIKE